MLRNIYITKNSLITLEKKKGDNMKVAVVSNNKKYFEAAIKKEKDLTLVKDSPDVVIAFGGEGTFLYSEMIYPGIPKVLVRHSSKCKKCDKHDYQKVLNALLSDDFGVAEFLKVQGSIKGRMLVGLNEINIHYTPPCAMRFGVDVDKETLVEEGIGDGLIVSTVYGSSGYFFSITRKTFDKGLGIAFNNLVKPVKTRIIPENSVIKVKIIRGPAVMCADCNKEIISLKTGDVVRIQKHSNFARILQLEGKRMVRI